jgi:hypothetical protein
MKDVGKFYGQSVYIFDCHFVYFIAIWYILWSFWYFPPVLVYCTKKNLATLESGKKTAKKLMPAVPLKFQVRRITATGVNVMIFEKNIFSPKKVGVFCLKCC